MPKEITLYGFHSHSDNNVDYVIKPVFSENTGFTEGQAVHFLSPKGIGWSLRIDDEPLSCVDLMGKVAWQWSPGFFAGEVTAELIDPDGHIADTYLLDVSPNPNKLGHDTFHQMLDETWEADPTLVLGTEPAQLQVGDTGSESNRLLMFARMRRYGPSAVKALIGVSRAPITTLRSTRDQVPIHRVRRADRQTAMAALKEPELLNYLTASNHQLVGHSGVSVDIPEIEPHLDNAANRCITAIAKRLLRTSINLRKGMEDDVLADKENSTRTELAPRWPVRRSFLDKLIRDIKGVLKRSPYVEITREEVTAAGLNAVSAHPIYSRAYRYCWQAQRIGLCGQHKNERLWLSPTWEVYENWCYVRLLKLLKNKYSAFEWSKINKHSSSPTAVWEGTNEKDSIIRLFLQPLFVPYDGAKHREFRSISGRRYPDIVLTIETDKQKCLYVFDSKYRSTRQNLLDAMASAHIYHDALRWNGDKPKLALLLAPSTDNVAWLLESEFQYQTGVGIRQLSLSSGEEFIEQLLI